jgi:glycosyltransferase involved in cell wall biosynthesis
MSRQIAQLAGQGEWDAVVALELSAAPYAHQIAGTPCIFDLNVSASYQRFRQYSQGVKGWRWLHSWIGWQKTRRYERRLCRDFAACTVVLAAEAAYLREMLTGTGCRVLVSENGVDVERNRPAAVERTANSLIYPGALTYEANRDAVEFFLKEIYPLIKREEPDVAFIVTGSSEGVDLGRLPLDPSVRLTGYLPDPRPAIGSSAVCVIPLQQGTGTRLKILEAMALGVPVVSTSKGAEGLAVVDGKHLLLADEPEQFAHYTLQLLRNRAQGEALAADARRLVVERYDWRRIGAAFVSLVERVVSGRKARSEGVRPSMGVAVGDG